MLRYPVAGYTYSLASDPSDPCVGSYCDYFPDLAIGRSGGDKPVSLHKSYGIEIEFFPVEYVGLSTEFESWGYSTGYPVLLEDGTQTTFADNMFHVRVGALGRLPLLKDAGPLDLLGGLGYHAQDILYFHTIPGQDGAFGWTNAWVHGFYMEARVRYTIVGVAQPHVGCRGTLIGGASAGGMGEHDFEAGVAVRIYKGIVVDVQYQFKRREVDLTYEQGATTLGDHATIEESTHGAVFGVGYAF